MKNPHIRIDLKKIAHNCRLLQEKGKNCGINIVGVTKSFDGDPIIAKLYAKSGFTVLGDSRMENILRMKAADVPAKFMLLRIPMLSEAQLIAENVDYCLISETISAQALSAANVAGRDIGLILMVEMGDLREGVMPDRAAECALAIERLPNVRLAGVGANFACFGGVAPTVAKMSDLLSVAHRIEAVVGRKLEIVSGGNSANIDMLLEGNIPKGINQLRFGESIILGREPLRRDKVPDAFTETITVAAEVVEVQKKPSAPYGEIAQDAYGQVPEFIDRGVRRRAICAVGRLDVAISGLTSLVEGVEILGGSSDHLILDVTDAPQVRLGSVIEFEPNYAAFVSAMLSPYLDKVYLEG